MIRDGKLSYAGSQSDWTSFEFENVVLNTLAISILATVFSYQAASIAHDLIFGFKSPGQAKARNLHILLLTRQSSPLAIVSSILRQDWLTLKRFSDDLAKNETIVRDEERIQSYVIMKLLFMIVIIPMVNILAIIASFGESQSLTFRDVKFGGLALDVNMTNPVQVRPHSRYCQLSVLSKGNNDYTDATFSLCFQLHAWEVDELESLPERGWATLFVLYPRNSSILVALHINGYFRAATKVAYVTLTGRPLMRLRSLHSQASSEVLANKSIELLSNECRVDNFKVTTSFFNEVNVIKQIPCPISVDESLAVVKKVIFWMLDKITMVESDKFEVRPFLGQPATTDIFELADDYPFLVRRTRYVSVPFMVIITAGTVVIRALMKLLLNNDLGEGVHQLLKKRLGLLCWDSLLRTDAREVSYFRVASGARS